MKKKILVVDTTIGETLEMKKTVVEEGAGVCGQEEDLETSEPESQEESCDCAEECLNETEEVSEPASTETEDPKKTPKKKSVKKVTAKAFILSSLVSGPKTVDALSQEYLDAGLSRVAGLEKCKKSLAVQISHMKKANEILRVSRGTYKLPDRF